jgi:hypothetical protein
MRWDLGGGPCVPLYVRRVRICGTLAFLFYSAPVSNPCWIGSIPRCHRLFARLLQQPLLSHYLSCCRRHHHASLPLYPFHCTMMWDRTPCAYMRHTGFFVPLPAQSIPFEAPVRVMWVFLFSFSHFSFQMTSFPVGFLFQCTLM